MRKIVFIAFISLINSCSKPFEVGLAGASEILVFEGAVKNGLNSQLIKLWKLEETEQVPILDASIEVREYANGSLLNTYMYQHDEEGRYKLEFQGEIGLSYQVNIELSNGEIYQSTLEKLLAVSDISQFKALENIRDDGDQVISILVSSDDATSESSRRYFYSFTETYVISPDWTSFYLWDGDKPVGRPSPFDPICWRTIESKSIILKSTQNLASDRVNDLLINQLLPDDQKLRNKYSIEVGQSSLSERAYNYFNALLKSIENPNALTSTQPGNPTGNIQSMSGKTAIGYFMAIDTKNSRLFIEPSDFQSIGNIPYNRFCEPTIFGDIPELRLFLNTANNSTEFLIHVGPESGWWVFPRDCIDCSHLGTTERPEFWE